MLWHTIANIIKKSNLNADKQAVREMNMALAEWEASHGYPKDLSVEDAMQALADAGYNSENWQCLTQGYQVYWYDIDNRCILYNAATGEVEYPEEYDADLMLSAGSHLHIYNENHRSAQNFVMSLKSSFGDNTTNIVGYSAANYSSVASANATVNGVVVKDTVANSNSTANLNALASTSVQTILKNSLADKNGNPATNVVMYATREDVSIADATGTKAYASMQISAVGTTANLEDSGKVKENLFYISIVGDSTKEGYADAKKAAGHYVYTIFDQITEGKLGSNITVILAPGTVIDCSEGGNDWAPCKYFSGYFGTTDEANPIIIDGAELTTRTGYAQTVYFEGSELKINGVGMGHSKYFVTGFFGMVYGNTTIENVTFRNITMENPATDVELSGTQTRNTIGIIGGIGNSADGTYSDSDQPANVLISHVNVIDSNITGAGGVGGLVGYIGTNNHGNGSKLTGNIKIENCSVSAKLTSNDNKTSFLGSSYSPVGGIIGLANNSSNPNVTVVIDHCSFKGIATGYDQVSGCVGDNISGNIPITITDCDFTEAVLNSASGTTAGLCSTNASSHSKLTVSGTAWNTDYYPLCYAQSNAVITLDGTQIKENTKTVCRFLDVNKVVKVLRLYDNGSYTNVNVAENGSQSNLLTAG